MMDTLENYRAEFMKKNKRHVDEDDPICVLHTFLAKFEKDLIASLEVQSAKFSSRWEEQYKKLEDSEKERMEKALSFVKASAEAQLSGFPQRLNDAIEDESFKKLLISCALETMKDRMTIPLPQSVWICCGFLAALNIFAIALLILHIL